MSVEQYAELVQALTGGDRHTRRQALENIQSEIDKACETDGFSREDCFELLVDIRNLLDHYVATQF